MKYIILGAGGTGRTIAGVLQGEVKGICFIDDKHAGKTINGFKVIGTIKDIPRFKKDNFIIGFGNTYAKERIDLFNNMEKKGFKFFNAIHKNAYIDQTAKIGKGVFIAANCAVNPNAAIDDNSSLCVACTIDHDSKIGKHVYISPGVNIAGAAVVGDNVFIGTNAAILPLVKIGKNSIIGAGSVITKDIPPNVTAVGVPAKIIKKHNLKK